MWSLKLFMVIGIVMLASGCATREQKLQAFEHKVKTVYIPECQKSLGLTSGQAITEEQRANLEVCGLRLIAKDKLDNGSNDPAHKALAIWIPNCEAILGTDWGEVGSEKRTKLTKCVEMQGTQDLENQRTSEQVIELQRMINSNTQKQIINCYTYGNWTQCK